jgi:hypothetical protein
VTLVHAQPATLRVKTTNLHEVDNTLLCVERAEPRDLMEGFFFGRDEFFDRYEVAWVFRDRGD